MRRGAAPDAAPWPAVAHGRLMLHAVPELATIAAAGALQKHRKSGVRCHSIAAPASMRRLVAAAFAAGGAAQAAAAAGPPPELVGHAATPLLDGCTHAFLDLGANAGVQTRKLHQPKLYARSSFVPLFQKAGFYKDGAVRCAVGVEPAREYWQRLRELATRLTNRGMRTTFVLGGVGRCGNQPVLRVTRPCWLRQVVMNRHERAVKFDFRTQASASPTAPPASLADAGRVISMDTPTRAGAAAAWSPRRSGTWQTY